MVSFNSDDFMVAWTDETVEVGPWPDRTGWSRGKSTTGCCDAWFQEKTPAEKAQILVNVFLDLALGKGLSPTKIQQEFMKIDTWRDMKIDLPSGRYVAHYDGNWSPHNP